MRVVAHTALRRSAYVLIVHDGGNHRRILYYRRSLIVMAGIPAHDTTALHVEAIVALLHSLYAEQERTTP